ncbi:RebB family R body protein, partial [Pseudomonas aeruginosa]|nr:RebB family R body protein [Pseudomonas aeruginosa]
MSFPTAVNNQITDAVTQSNVKVVGEAPAMALGSIFQTMA